MVMQNLNLIEIAAHVPVFNLEITVPDSWEALEVIASRLGEADRMTQHNDCDLRS